MKAKKKKSYFSYGAPHGIPLLDKVQLFIWAKGLKNVVRHSLTKHSNPFAVVTKIEDESEPVVLGKTKVIQNCLSPVWVEAFYVEYKISKPITISISIYHENHKDKKTKLIGSAIFEIGEIMGSRGSTKSKKLKQGGVCHVTAVTSPAVSSGNLVLSLQGVQLRNIERTGLSDPFYEVSRKMGTGRDDWHAIYRSETIMNSLDPIWEPASIDLDRLCDGNRHAPFRISLYDFENNGAHKRMGWVYCTMNSILKKNSTGSTTNIKTFDLTKGKGAEDKNYGKITINDAYIVTSKGHEIETNNNPEESNLNITLEINLKDASYLLFEFLRVLDDGSTKMTIFRSERLVNEPFLAFEQVSIPMSKLCDDDPDKSITIAVLDHKVGKDRNYLLGDICTTVRELIEAQSDNPNEVEKLLVIKEKEKKTILDQKVGKDRIGDICTTVRERIEARSDSLSRVRKLLPMQEKERKTIGAIRVLDASIIDANGTITPLENQYKKPSAIGEITPLQNQNKKSQHEGIGRRKPTFVDYIGGGCELRMCIAVDFSSSNGPLKRPDSHHYLHPDGELNDYEKAMARIGSILSKYDHKQDIPVWGFGAKINGIQQNCFQIGRSGALAYGLKQVIQFYRDFVSMRVSASSKAVITEIVENASNFAIWEKNNGMKENRQVYTVLIILTDGDLSELSEAKKAIGRAGDAPLSIVIVGIGDGDFSDMQLLDEFYEGDNNSGRDITQFVEFNAHNETKHSLNSAVLDEIPCQVVEYFQRHGINPNPPAKTDTFDLKPDDFDEDDFVLDLCFEERDDTVGVCERGHRRVSTNLGRKAENYERSLAKIREEDDSGKSVNSSFPKSSLSLMLCTTGPRCCT